MSEKSHVALEQNVCVVCGQPYDTGAILLDRRMRKQFDKHVVVGWGLCPDHQKLHDEDYVAMVGCDSEKSKRDANGGIKPEDAYRTGEIVHIRKPAFEHIFDVPVPKGMVCFTEPEAIAQLKAMMETQQ